MLVLEKLTDSDIETVVDIDMVDDGEGSSDWVAVMRFVVEGDKDGVEV